MSAVRNARWLILIAALMAPSLVWVCLDRGVWSWDPAFYGEETVVLGHALVYRPKTWISAMRHAVGFKPPGLAWLSQGLVPLGHLTGRMESCLLLSIIACQFAALAVMYRTARRLWPDANWTPAAGVTMAAGAPLFVLLSHQYFVEPAQLLVIAWFYLIAARSMQWHPWEWALHIVAASACGMLVKVTTPVYCFVPGAIACAMMARRYWLGEGWPELSPRRRKRLGFLWIFVAAFSLLGISWYVRNWEAVLHHAQGAASGDTALLYGHRDTLAAKAVFWLASLRDQFAVTRNFAAIYGLIGVGLGIRLWRAIVSEPGRSEPACLKVSSPRCWTPGDVLAAGALVQVLAVLAVLSLNINEDPRFLYGCLPSVALMLMWALAQIPVRWVSVLVLILACGQWVQSNRHGFWALTRNDGEYQEMTRLVDATSRKDLREKYNIIGVDTPWLNHNTASFFSAKRLCADGWRVRYAMLGYTESDQEQAWRRLMDDQDVYFISLESVPTPRDAPDPFNVVAGPILKRVMQDARFQRVPFPTQKQVLIYGRAQAGSVIPP